MEGRIIILKIVVAGELHLSETFDGVEIAVHKLPVHVPQELPRAGLSLSFQGLSVVEQQRAGKTDIVAIVTFGEKVPVVVRKGQLALQKRGGFYAVTGLDGGHTGALRCAEQEHRGIVALQFTVLWRHPAENTAVGRIAQQHIRALPRPHIGESHTIELPLLIRRKLTQCL